LQGKLASMNPKSWQTKFCTSIRVEQKQTVLFYQSEASRAFLRIGLATPNLVPQVRSELPPSSAP
jgi:hypothetical protein